MVTPVVKRYVYICLIRGTVENAAMEVAEKCTAFSLDSADRVRLILEKAGLLQFAGNPLVAKSIDACLER